MPNPENIINKGFDKNPQNINKKGRPKKIYTILKKGGYSKDDIRTVFFELQFYTIDELKNLVNRNDVPAIVLIVAKAISEAINKGEFHKVKEIIEQVIGKPDQNNQVGIDLNANVKNTDIDLKTLSTETLDQIIKEINKNDVENKPE